MAHAPRLDMFVEERSACSVTSRAVSLLLAVAGALKLPIVTKYFALSLLCERTLPVLTADGAASEAPALAPLTLACVLVASKVHAPLLRISQLRGAANAVAPGSSSKVSAVEVANAELWLCTNVNISNSKLLICRIEAMLSEIQAKGASAGVQLTEVQLDCCCAILDVLHESNGGILLAGGPGLASAIILAAAMISIHPRRRAAAAPWFAWLASAADERLDDVQRAAQSVLAICLE